MDLQVKKILEVSEGERYVYDASETWVDLFKKQAGKHPDRIAVADEKGSMTYKELDEASDRMASYLLDKGLKENAFVAIRMGRSKEFNVAVLGVHKAGGAYVPLDMEYPAGRVTYMLEDSEAKIVITEKLVKKAVETCSPLAEKDYKQSPEGLAYMIYTSGSTGKPKGVMIQHKALVNFVHFIRERWHLTEKSRIACHSNFAFDASVEDLYPALTAGGCVYIVPEEARRDIFEMRKCIEKNGITGGCYTTRFGQMLAGDEPLDVDYIVLGGEAMTNTIKARGAVYNTYGPTEFTVDATYFELEKGKEYNPIPIGRPLYNCAAFILGENKELLPLGEVGELCLSGTQIAKGYWKRPELTAEKFIDIKISDDDVRRVYRTGDLARYNEDGQLEFFGRIDFQVKLRGFRIELGEVESAALKYPDVIQAAAEVKHDTLCLYYTASKDIDEQDWKSSMEESLTDYMIPGCFIRLDKMPETPNGKLDRKALPEPVMERDVEYVAPRNEMEQAVADCMKKALERDVKIGALDNFFEIGGDSIKAIRMVSFLREQGIFLKSNDVLKHRVVEKIALCAKRGSDEVKLSQEPIEGLVEDSGIFLFYQDLAFPDSAYFNQSTLLEWKGRADLAALQAAFDGLTFQHDMLRTRFEQGHLFVKAAVSGEHGVTLEEYTLTDDTDKIKELCEDIQSHLDVEKALVRAALLHAGERDLFFVTAHHTIVDGISWRILLEDLETAYGQAISKEPVKLPKKTHTYQDYAKAMKEYRDSYALSQEIPYWQETVKKVLSMETSKGKDYSRHFAQLEVSLDKDGTEKLLSAKLSAYQLEINDLLLSAVGRSYRETFGKDSLSLQLEGHGREYIGKELLTDRTIGWFTSIYPVVLENLNGDARHDLIRVKETLHRIPNKGVGYNILTFVQGKDDLEIERNLIPKLVFNYLGDVAGDEDNKKYFAPDSKDGFSTGLDYQSVKNCDGPDLAINCLIDGGRFSLHLGYNEDMYDEKTARSFAQGILGDIGELAAHLEGVSVPVVTASDLGETSWNEEEFNRVVTKFAARGEHIERIYPLTPLQEGMLLSHVMDPTASAYRLVDIYALDFLPTEKELRIALDALAEKHEVLRTAIIHDGVSVHRQAITDRKLGLSMLDISNEQDTFAAANGIREKLLREGFDLQRKPLFQIICAKTSDNSSCIITAVHHIIVDGWCVGMYLEDFECFLRMAKEGIEHPEILSTKNGLYESMVRELIAKDRNAATKYFSELLEGYDNQAEIPAYGTIRENEKYRDNRIIKELDAGLVGRFEKMCRSVGATLSNGMELAWGMVLQTVCRLDDVVFAKVVSGRDNTSADVSDLVGLFINSIPVRLKREKESTAAELLKNLHEQSLEGNEFDFCPLADIQTAVGMTEGLVYSILSFENYGDVEEGLSMLKPMLIKEEHVGDYVGIDATALSDGSIEVILSFDPNRYRKVEMERIFALLETYITCMTEYPHNSIRSMPLVGIEQEEELIALSRGKTYEYDMSETWLDLFLKQVTKRPEHTAVVDSTGKYTYDELDHVSNSIAAWLIEKGTTDEDFVALRMGRVKEFLAGVISAQKVGAAYVPIDPTYPEDRIAYMLEDSGARAILTEEAVAEAIAKYPDAEAVNRAVPEGRAYMIYTSGSTGRPKGVVQSHRSLRAFVEWQMVDFDITEKSVHAVHPSFSFDASLDDLICPIAGGAEIHILSEELRRDMADMKEYFVDNGITMASFPTQIGMAMINQYPDLPLRYVMMGGEKMLPCRKTDIRLVNGYGPTEFTVCSSYHVIDQEKDKDIPIGRPVPNTWSFICDTYGHLMPKGMAGELCLAGNQIAEGYWNKPELTAMSFVECSYLKGQRMYRTGDLARYNEDGELEYLGRIDNQVKLRGFRIEMGEIENRASQYDGIEQVAAAVRKDQLVLYYTHREGIEIDAGELHRFLSETLTEYMVPTVYMPLRAMPMTPNGKINRKALPEPEVSVVGENVPPESETEARLFEIAAGLLKSSQFGVTDNLVSLGLSSIGAMRLAAEIGQACDLRIPVAEILRTPTIRALAAWVEQAGHDEGEQLRPYPKQKLYPITENQRGIIIDWEQNRETTQYNVPEVIVFDGVDGETLASAVRGALDAHAYLKTRFLYADGDIMQQRRDEDTPEVILTELDEAPNQDFFRSRILLFNLFSECLYRMEVYTFGHRTWLFMDIHHTVYDGLSRNVFVGDIHRGLKGENLKGETLTAYDFALYEKELQIGENYEEAKKHFDALMNGASPAVLPDSRQPDGKPAGTFDLRIPAEGVDKFCKDCGVTAGSFFQAAFGETLRRLTREEKPFYVTVSNGRSASLELMDSVGMFVKTLPVVVVPNSGDMTCRDFVRAMHEELQESYAREFYPYTDIVETHGLRAEVIFAYQGEVGDNKQETRDSASMELNLNAVKLPISMEIFPKQENYVLKVEYDGMRYSRTDVESFTEMVKDAALGLAKQNYVKEVSTVSADEAKELLALSAGETLEYNKDETWVDLFLKYSKETPENTAVVDSVGAFTYRELDRASNSIAAWLVEKGVVARSFVALRMGRVKEFLAAVIGVHKAGAAYTAIDPTYPEDRIAYMLEDSEAKIVMTEETVAEALAAYPDAAPMNRAVPEGRAYMVYTSGSTGKPKGVVIQHKAMLNFVHFIRKRLHLTERSRVTCHSTFSFDGSVEGLYPAITIGGSVFIVPEEARRDIFEIKAFLRKHEITGGFYSTQFGQVLASGSEPLDLDYICVGGEAMTRYPNVRGSVYNVYGPTEFTVYSTYFELEKGKEYNPIPIGRPLFNSWAFVCDANGQLLPKGMAGELCMAGVQLAEGYWKRPELTARSFVDCPFMKGQKMYRTGDLVRYNEDGELEYIGRIDHQVKLRGFRIEMGEIEKRASQYDGIEQVAAAVKKEQLVLYYIQGKGTRIDAEQLKSFLAETLTDYMVPTVYVPLDVMPLTPNGKINRKILPMPDIQARKSEYEAPTNENEKKLCDAFAKVLGMPEHSVGRNDDFYLLGGNSIKSMLVMTTAGIEGLSAKTIFKCKTAKLIAEELSNQMVENLQEYEENARKQSIPATLAQILMIDDQFMNVNVPMYNLPCFFRFDAKLDAEKLAKAVDTAVEQHPSLSSVFEFDENGEIRQHIEPSILPKTTVEDITEADLDRLTATLVKPFRLFSTGLFRSKVFRCGETVYLFMDVNHIVSDGTSQGVLLKDISRAYWGKTFEQDYYYSYLMQEWEARGTKAFDEAKQYFRNLLGDKKWCRIPTPDFETWETESSLEKEDGVFTVRQMEAAEKRWGFSRTVFAITAAMLALQEYCHRDEINVDYLNSNRTEKYLQNTVGLVFKLLPLAVDLQQYPSIERLMQEVNRQVIESFANSICDYSAKENIAEEDAIVVNYVAQLGDASNMEGFEATELPLEGVDDSMAGHADLYLQEKNGEVNIFIEYLTHAYAEGSIRKFLDIYIKHLKQLVNG